MSWILGVCLAAVTSGALWRVAQLGAERYALRLGPPPAVLLLVSVVLGAAAVAAGGTVSPWVLVPFAGVLAVCVVTDLRHRLIFNVVLLCGAALVVTAQVATSGVHAILPMALGAACGSLIVASAAMMQRRDVAAGDLKLMAFMGLVLGAEGVAVAFLCGSLIAIAWYVRSIARSRELTIPWAPFAAAGALTWAVLSRVVVR
jgi:prepilin signal peptidase PulO-like enzyme (type II secretory pathway)